MTRGYSDRAIKILYGLALVSSKFEMFYEFSVVSVFAGGKYHLTFFEHPHSRTTRCISPNLNKIAAERKLYSNVIRSFVHFPR
jgi:hypothetical protein